MDLAIYAVTVLALIGGFGWYLRDLTRRHAEQMDALLVRVQSPDVAQAAALETVFGERTRAAATPSFETLVPDEDLNFDTLMGEV